MTLHKLPLTAHTPVGGNAALFNAKEAVSLAAWDCDPAHAPRLMAINAEIGAMMRGTDPDAARALFLPAWSPVTEVVS